MNAVLSKLAWSVLGLALCASCSTSSKAINNDHKSVETSRHFSISDFNSIENRGVADIKIIQTTGDYYMDMEGDTQLMNATKIAIKDNTLSINQEFNGNKPINGKLKIIIGMPSLKSINTHGVGNIAIRDLRQDRLAISTNGVGNLDIERLKCCNLSVECHGVGNIILKGTATNILLESHGVGNINTLELEADNVTAFSRGVGSIECNAANKLEASASNIGNIKYKGDPQVKDISFTGMGHVSRI